MTCGRGAEHLGRSGASQKRVRAVLLKRMSIADGLTIANGLCGLAAIIVALSGTQVLGTHGHALSQARFLTCAALIVAGG